MTTTLELFQRDPENENRWIPNHNVLIRTNEIVLLPYHETRIVEGPYYTKHGFVDNERTSVIFEIFVRNPNTKEFVPYDDEAEIVRQLNSVVESSLRHRIRYNTRRCVEAIELNIPYNTLALPSV